MPRARPTRPGEGRGHKNSAATVDAEAQIAARLALRDLSISEPDPQYRDLAQEDGRDPA